MMKQVCPSVARVCLSTLQIWAGAETVSAPLFYRAPDAKNLQSRANDI
jgi:hypothetical protein